MSPIPYVALGDERGVVTETTRRSSHGRGYFPALDGLRALAVGAVLLYHHQGLNSPGIGRGGYVGVDVFFVLSGFLITSLLVAERRTTGGIAFGRFWSRRARRLLPALLVTLIFAGVLTQLVYSNRLGSQVRADLYYVLFYVQNWHVVFWHGGTSPISHLWSLSVEEQFYLVWPAVLTALWIVTVGRVRRLAGVLIGLALASAIWTAVLWADGNVAHAYFGTDARAQELLVGAILAVIGSEAGLTLRNRHARAGLDAAALLALVAFAAVVAWVNPESGWYYGGWLLLAVSTAIVITAAVQPTGHARALLAVAPLVAIGRVSYGLYLFHFPVYAWLGPAATGQRGVRLLMVRLAVTAAAATLSYLVVEQPIRTGRVRPRVVLGLGAIATTAAVVLTTVGVRAPLPGPRSDVLAFTLREAASRVTPGNMSVLVVGGQGAARLGLATGGTFSGNGIFGLAIGTGACGLTTPGRVCRAVPDDLAALGRAFPAKAVVLMPDAIDLAGFDEAVVDPRSTKRLKVELDTLLRAAGRRRLVMLSVPCVPGKESARAAFNQAASTWAQGRGVRFAALGPSDCAHGGPLVTAAETWLTVARSVRLGT